MQKCSCSEKGCVSDNRRARVTIRLCVDVELNIPPGLLYFCVGGEASEKWWASSRSYGEYRAAGSEDIIKVWEDGIICQGRGRWGSFKMPFSFTRQPLPPAPHCLPSLCDSLSYFTPSLSHVFLVSHSATPSLQIHWEDKKTESRSKLLILQKRGDKPVRRVKVCNCSTFSLAHSSFPSATLCCVICLLPLSYVPPTPHSTTTTRAVSHYLYCFPSNKRIDQCHSQCLSCLASISLMRRLPLAAVLEGCVGRGFRIIGGGGYSTKL